MIAIYLVCVSIISFNYFTWYIHLRSVYNRSWQNSEIADVYVANFEAGLDPVLYA